MPDVLVGEVLAEVHQEGDLPHQVVGQEGDHLGLATATMVSPDLSVEILELPLSLVRKDFDLLGRNCGGMFCCYPPQSQSFCPENYISLLQHFILSTDNLKQEGLASPGAS